ncbi:aldolase/citrate lyase family protein [Methylocystis heyeri]|nr:aldolase/citrate lyase family protein [Methylocystis heyeri]
MGRSPSREGEADEDDLRSCLILPEDPLPQAQEILSGGADAVMLDLRAADAAAWRNAISFLRLARSAKRRPATYVRPGPLDGGGFDAALSRLGGAPPDGIFLDSAEGAAGVQRLGAKLAVFEAENGLADGATAIAAIAAQSPAAVFLLGGYAGCSRRLEVLAFDPSALARALAVDPASPPVATARSLTILAAAAAGVPAIEIFCEGGDHEAGRERLLAARRDGFTGAATRRPKDIPIINETFGPAPPADPSTNRPNPGHSLPHDAS